MTVTDEMHVVYPVPDATFDAELKRLTAAHPGIGKRTRPAAAKAARWMSRSLRRGWARVRGTLGSLAGLATGVGAAFTGWGLVPGLVCLAVAFVVTEWLLK
jgi:hypothetical protein